MGAPHTHPPSISPPHSKHVPKTSPIAPIISNPTTYTTMPPPASTYCCLALTMSYRPPLLTQHPPTLRSYLTFLRKATASLPPPSPPPHPPSRPPPSSCRRPCRHNAARLASCRAAFLCPPYSRTSLPPPTSIPSSHKTFHNDSCRLDICRIE